MSVSSEVQRTLVKSPPELWAELSDPAALARHLGELGEIRITRIEPEKTVEWEAADTTGKVLLKPSGWGTKVTLTAARELSAPEPPPEPSMEVESEPVPVAVEEPEPEVVLEEPEPRSPGSEPRSPGFFARLFRRRIKDQALPEPPVELDLTVEPEPAPEDVTPPQDTLPDETPDIAAELKAAEEEVASGEVTAMLTAVLDRLGAAHHRPFSRA